jgi:serine protease Do
MLKRKEFILGAAVGLSFAAVATAGGVISWPGAHAAPAAQSSRLVPSAGAAGVAFAPPQGAPLSFADIFQQVAPAVVQIDVKTRVQRPAGATIQIPGFGAVPIPGQPRGGATPEGEDDNSTTALGAGSGFFISADGYIVTNNHVVADATEITVKLSDDRELTARLIGRDPDTDLAVIKVDGGNFPFVSFEDKAEPRVGDWVIAVGNPFGLGGTATAGIVSAKARDIGGNENPYTDFIQIDAAINRGNSGGPTFDIYGRVIGVNSAIYSPTGGSVGIGFAIPAGIAKATTDRLMRGETIERGYLGVQIGPITRDYQSALGLASRNGAFIADVTADGPADKAGLKAGDIVLKLNGRDVRDANDLTRQVGGAKPGDQLRLDILRDGRAQTVNVRSGTRPPTAVLYGQQNGEEGAEATPPARADAGVEVGGVKVAPMSSALRQQYDIPAAVDGLVITARGRGDNAVLEPGFVIMRAGNGPVRTVEDLRAAIAASKAAGRDSVFLLLKTGTQNNPYVLKLPKSE